MPSCAALQCTNKQFKGCGVTFHRFPGRDIERKRKWLINMGRSYWTPKLKSCICSNHFTPECFDKTGQTVRLRENAIPTIFSIPPKAEIDFAISDKSLRKKSQVDVEKDDENMEVQNVASRPKRTIKVKRRDDEIYTMSKPKVNRTATGKTVKNEASGQRNVVTDKKRKNLKRKKIADMKLTDENAAILKRIQESMKDEKETLDDSQNEDELPRKRIPKPSFKLRVKQEHISEDEGLSDDVSFNEDFEEDTEYDMPILSPKKAKRPPVKISSDKDESGHFDEATIKEEKIEELTVTSGKTQSAGKDKITQLPNNRMYFEFAEPKKKVILQIKPPDPGELNTQTLADLVNSLELRNLIKGDGQYLLESFKEFPEGLLLLSTKLKKKLGNSHTESIKKFATILYLFSPKAFDVVSTVFCLPSKNLLQERLISRHSWPGFTQEVLDILKYKCPKEGAESVSIMFDIIPMKKKSQFDSQEGRVIGHVDFCGGPTPDDFDGMPLASEILQFTVVGIGRDWKLPFGYFLFNELSGETLQNIVTEAIQVLEECGFKVRAIVCDGSPITVKMSSLFGCNIYTKSFTEVVTNFPHPLSEERRIHLVFGIHYALSLLRSLLAEKSFLRSSTYGIIKWKYFEQLRDTKVATKLRTAATNFELTKLVHMQKILRHCHSSFSSMESRAFESIHELKLVDIEEENTAAANFVADIYRAFDLLNSRNPVTSGEKPPLASPFLAEQIESMNVISQRIFGLEFLSGKKVINDGRWLSVMLFAFTLKSVSNLASELLNDETLMYVTTHQWNFDHSDLILRCIQSYGEWDNEPPTAVEYRKGYKELVESVTESVKDSYFCSDFDGQDLTIGQGLICPFKRYLNVRGYEDIRFVERSHYITDCSNDMIMRGRCVIKHISQRLTCADCVALMIDDNYSDTIEKNIHVLECVRPSKFLIEILKVSESVVRLKLLETKQVNVRNIVPLIFTEYITNFEKVHQAYSDHMMEDPHHIICLIKIIIQTFISFRLDAMKNQNKVKPPIFMES